MSIRFSPSALNVFRDCPACFWRDKKQNIKRPQGIKSSLPMAIDRILKARFDASRPEFPSETNLANLEGFSLYKDQGQLDRWRNWRSGMVYNDPNGRFVLTGAVDDLIVAPDDRIAILDYKSKGTAASESYAETYYQFQMDCYSLMLSAQSDIQAFPRSYLAFYYPQELQFQSQIISISNHPENAVKVCNDAVDCLEDPSMPKPSVKEGKTCEHCCYLNQGMLVTP